MGTPVGTKFKARQAQTKADIKRLQELREKHPEEFGRGRMLAQEAADPYELGLGLGTLGMMTPYGRTTFDMAGGGAAPQGIFRNPELGFRPRGRGPGPEGAPINAGFDVPRGMNRFEANQYYMTHGIPGEDIYRRSNYGGELPGYTPRGRFPSPGGEPIEMGAPYWPNAVPRDMNRFQANTYGMSYGRPGDTMHRFSNMDFVPENVPGQFGPLAPRGTTMPASQRGGLPMMVEERGIPYADYRDVTGNVLRGPEGQRAGGPIPMGASMATRMGEGAYRYEPVRMPPRGGFPYGEAALTGAAIGGPAGIAMWNYNRPGVSATPQGGQPQIGPYDFGMMPGPQGMEAMQNLPAAPQGIMAAPSRGGPSASRGGGKKAAGVPMPSRRPAELSQPQGQFEGNFNYDVTRAIDALLGQNQAERGRQYQEYYANNPWPY